MFRGKQVTTIDAEGLLWISEPWHGLLDGDIALTVVSLGDRAPLSVWPLAHFKEHVQTCVQSVADDTQRRHVQRFFSCRALTTRLGARGCVETVSWMRDTTSLQRASEVLMLGVGDHLEVWNPGEWSARLGPLAELDFDV